MMEVKPIETQYKGYRFRSRLEARWAVFFDSLNIDWEYEPEGFELDANLRYLPDFVLKNFASARYGYGHKKDTFVEVKPKESFLDNKPEVFALKTGFPILLAVGAPAMKAYSVIELMKIRLPVQILDDGTEIKAQEPQLWKKQHIFTIKEWPLNDERVEFACLARDLYKINQTNNDILKEYYQAKILSAVCLARSSRFEHEEKKVY